MKTQAKLLKTCMLGDKKSCDKLNLTIMGASQVSLNDTDFKNHPNALPFEGVLLTLDQPSTKPPHGSQGHKINVPAKAAKENLKGLVGMGVNYDPGNLDEHMPRHKVGTITNAWIDGNKVKVSGIIYKKDFPEAVEDLSKRRDLGMSMELANVYVRDADAPVWILDDFDFTGATILRKDAAAYYQTSLAASSKASRAAKAAAMGEGATMPDKKKKVKVVAAAGTSGEINEDRLAAVIASAVKSGYEQGAAGTTRLLKQVVSKLDDLGGAVITAGAQDEEEDDEELDVEAGAEEDDVDADDDDEEISAAKDDKNDDEDDDEEEDPSDIDAELEDLEDKPAHSEPGKVNHAMKTKGRKTTTTEVGAEAMGKKPFGGIKSSSLTAAATTIRSLQSRSSRLEQKLNIQASAHSKEIKKMKRSMERMEAQLSAAADRTTRRSIPTDLTNLAAKSNVDLHELAAAGQKLSVGQVDQIIAASGYEVDPVQKMAWKNRLLEAGLMDEGRIETRQ